MKKHFTFIAGLLFLAARFAAAGVIAVDFDRNADFCKFKTFSWLPGTPAPNPETERAIHDAVAAQLKAGGLTRGKPDGNLQVVTHVQVDDGVVIDFRGMPYVGWDGGSVTVGAGDAGRLIVDLVDPATTAP